MNTALIENTISFVKKELQNAEGGHDWFHIERVYNNALNISKEENCDETIVALGALLHDIADSKFHNVRQLHNPQLLFFAQALLICKGSGSSVIMV